jgi:hypothetical protein
MTEENRKQLDPKMVEWLDNVKDSKGLNRQVLEVENIKTNTKLATETLKKLKSDFWQNIFFIILGVAIGYLPNLLSEDKTTEAIELMNTLMIEKQKQHEDFQTEAHQMRLELSSLKKEIDSLSGN